MTETSFDLVVIGAGPGGYATAFRAADLGLRVCLIEKHQALGGVCLNVGCIPSKALLHTAELINAYPHLEAVSKTKMQPIQFDPEKLRAHKNTIIKKFNQGISMMAKKRKVTVITGHAQFASENTLQITLSKEKTETIRFSHAVIATGSRPIKLPFLPKDPRIFDSTGALELTHTKGHLLIIGGGVIGCEMATIYRSLGMDVSIVEMQDQLMPGADKDIVKPCQKIMRQRGIRIHIGTQVVSVSAEKKHLTVQLKDEKGHETTQHFHAILESIGRIPNADALAVDKAHVKKDNKGFIMVDSATLATSNPCVFAIGDVTPGPGLAHKATAQGRTVAEIIAGKKVVYDVKAMPAVAYTDPEVAWVGLTEHEATQQGITYKKGVFPWMASGRAVCMDADVGCTKLLSDPKTGQILGAGIVGKCAGDLIAEVSHAIEMGSNVEDIALTVHPHPTLSESIGLSAEIIEGTITDM